MPSFRRGHDEAWKEERRAWVHAALSHDGDLRSTPLTIVSIALLAVTSSDPSDLPTERARVLQQVLLNVLARDVSIREGDLPTVGALEGTEAKYALEMTYPELSAVAELIRERRPRFRIWARELLAFGSLLAAETPESEAGGLLASSDPFDRSGAAEWWSWEVRSRRPLPAAIFECATDTDRNVRASLLDHLKQEHVDDDELRAGLDDDADRRTHRMAV